MKIVNLARWIIRIILFILLLLLIFDNMQSITFNLFGIYHPTMPLIILTIVFLGVGILIGLIMGMMRNLELKAKIRMLEKELKLSTNTKEHGFLPSQE
jgi:uncharacterized integral membrane protein